MRFRRPRRALIIAVVALFVLAAGAAYAASAKPHRANTPAAVSSSAASIKPGSFFHAAALALSSSPTCNVAAQPPAGQALIVTQVRVNVFNDPTPGTGNRVSPFIGSPNPCTLDNLVGDVNPATVGQTTITFDPGLGIPAGSSLNINVGGGVQAEVYTDGYVVSAKQVPAATIPHTGGGLPQQ